MGSLVEDTNQTLIKVGEKPILSRIVESYPQNITLVITLGYYGQYVKDFLEIAYPDRKFEFIWVDKYTGRGSSLVYSISKASAKLQCPFIYHAGDTLVKETIPPPNANWNGGMLNLNLSQYRSFDILKDKVVKFYDKGVDDTDYVHIGLLGIKDYELFWKSLRSILKASNPDITYLSDVHVLAKMLELGTEFKLEKYETWHDVGYPEGLYKARVDYRDKYTVLDKKSEAIYFVGNKVIKFFSESNVVSDRIKRAELLSGLVPKIVNERSNFYAYSYVKGDLFANIVNKNNFLDLLKWASKYLWQPLKDLDKNEFVKACIKFYKEKTYERVKMYLKKKIINDKADRINGLDTPSISDVLSKVDFIEICQTEPYRFHGDFILDNILKTENGFCLLDWRQDFGGRIDMGDRYYDLSKLSHNLLVNHRKVNGHQFKIIEQDRDITCEVEREQRFIDCENILFDFINQNNYNARRVKVLRGIIWLNMSPLHEPPLDDFLYYFGKYHLWKSLNE